MTISADRCHRCRGPVYPHQRFCEQCGAPLAGRPADAAPAGLAAERAAPAAGQSGMAGCCLAAVVGFVLVFCFGLALAAGLVYLLGPRFSFGP